MATTRTPKWSTIVLRTVGVTILVVAFVAIDIVALTAPSCTATRLTVLLICSSIAIYGFTARLVAAICDRLKEDEQVLDELGTLRAENEMYKVFEVLIYQMDHIQPSVLEQLGIDGDDLLTACDH